MMRLRMLSLLTCALGILLLPAGAVDAAAPKIDICHTTEERNDEARLIHVAASSLQDHLDHGDTIFGVGLDEDCAGGLSVRIDKSVKPNTPTLPGLAGGAARPVAAMLGPDGRRDEYVENELELKPSSQA